MQLASLFAAQNMALSPSALLFTSIYKPNSLDEN